MLASSMPTHIGWPVKLVVAIRMLSVLSQRLFRSTLRIERNRHGRRVGFVQKNTVLGAMYAVQTPCGNSTADESIDVCATYRRRARSVEGGCHPGASNSAWGWAPRSAASAFRSTTKAAAPYRDEPLRRRSNGGAFFDDVA